MLLFSKVLFIFRYHLLQTYLRKIKRTKLKLVKSGWKNMSQVMKGNEVDSLVACPIAIPFVYLSNET